MAKKIFSEKQNEIIARKLGYNGPMSEFEKFVQSDPAMERKLRLLTSRFMVKGGNVLGAIEHSLKLADGGSVTRQQVLDAYSDNLGRVPKEHEINFWLDYSTQNDATQTAAAFLVGANQELRMKEKGAAKAAASAPAPTPVPTSSDVYVPPPPPTPTAPTQKVEKIGTAKADQLLAAQPTVTAKTVTAAQTGTAAAVTAPTAALPETIDAAKSQTEVETIVDGNKAIVGALSADAQATAAEADPAETALKDLEAAKLANPQEIAGVPERTLQASELISGPAVNMATVEATLNKAEAAVGSVNPDMTVSGQLDKLLADFDAQNPPIWAASSMRSATSVLIARGVGASSLAGQAIIQATLEAAMPIATQDAQTIATLELQNLSNRQQMAVLVAQQRAAFLGQEFDQEFQTRVTNAAKISDIANLNFTAEQTIAIENAKLAQTVDLANLSNEQALVMAKAAQIANLESANLNNRQQAALQNAQAFLQLDLTNLNNEQQTALFNTEKSIQAIFTDTAAENAAKQFNATSTMQVQQFYDSLSAQVSQFNASQKNSMEQFNVSQTNAVAQFNASQTNAMEQFNAQNRLVVDQSNAEWRRQIALVDAGAINAANQFNAQASLQTTMAEYNNLWQQTRDTMEFVFKEAQNAAERQNTLAIAVLQKDAAIKAAEFALKGEMYKALGGVSASALSGTDISGMFKTGVGAIKDIFTDIGTPIPTLDTTDTTIDWGGFDLGGTPDIGLEDVEFGYDV